VSLEIKPGARFRSAVCSTEVAIVRGTDSGIDLWCGGVPMVALGTQPAAGAAPVAPFDAGTQIGKRYATEDGELELLCTKAGAGSLSVGATVLGLKSAKPLPASD
jgi:hypothetical protein